MEVVPYSGFWSYGHEDDEADGGRISALARSVVAEYEMLTGDTIQLFLDRDGIEWGDKWREEIGNTIESVAFFISVMTPRYFKSPSCRSELNRFARRAKEVGAKGLLLPLHYVNVPSLTDDSERDDLVSLVAEFQWIDWRELRYSEVGSEALRRGVSELAGRIATANKELENSSHIRVYRGEDRRADGEEEEDTPGILDRLHSAEEKWFTLTDSLTSMVGQTQMIGTLMTEATAEVKKPRGGRSEFARRIAIARRLAKRSSGPTDKISTLANQFASQIHDVDEGVRTIVDQASTEIERDPELRDDFCRFSESIRELSEASQDGRRGCEQMIHSIVPLEGMSRDLRPVMRRLRLALTIMIEGIQVTEGWTELIDAVGIDCDKASG